MYNHFKSFNVKDNIFFIYVLQYSDVFFNTDAKDNIEYKNFCINLNKKYPNIN